MREMAERERRAREGEEETERERWRAVQQQLAAVMTVVASIACLSVKTNLRRQPPGGPAALFVIEALGANIICTNRAHRSALAPRQSLPAAPAAIPPLFKS